MRRVRELAGSWGVWIFVVLMGNLLLTGLLTHLVPQTTYLTAPLVCPASTTLEYDWIGSSRSRSGADLHAFCVDSDGRRSDDIFPTSYLILYVALLLLWGGLLLLQRWRRRRAIAAGTSAT